MVQSTAISDFSNLIPQLSANLQCEYTMAPYFSYAFNQRSILQSHDRHKPIIHSAAYDHLAAQLSHYLPLSAEEVPCAVAHGKDMAFTLHHWPL